MILYDMWYGCAVICSSSFTLPTEGPKTDAPIPSCKPTVRCGKHIWKPSICRFLSWDLYMLVCTNRKKVFHKTKSHMCSTSMSLCGTSLHSQDAWGRNEDDLVARSENPENIGASWSVFIGQLVRIQWISLGKLMPDRGPGVLRRFNLKHEIASRWGQPRPTK